MASRPRTAPAPRPPRRRASPRRRTSARDAGAACRWPGPSPARTRRSAANITKIRKISSTPAKMEKMPKMREDRGEDRAADTCRRDHRVLAQHIQHFQVADPAQDLLQPILRLAAAGAVRAASSAYRAGPRAPAALGRYRRAARSATRRGVRSPRAGVVIPPPRKARKVGHVLFRTPGRGARGGAVRSRRQMAGARPASVAGQPTL